MNFIHQSLRAKLQPDYRYTNCFQMIGAGLTLILASLSIGILPKKSYYKSEGKCGGGVKKIIWGIIKVS